MTRRVRLISGCVLFAYVATHLTNHSLGLISLSAMEAGREWFLLLWRNPLGTAALYGALGVHFALGLWALYRRQNLRMPAGEAGQLALGLMIVSPLKRLVNQWRRKIRPSAAISRQYNVHILGSWV